MGSREGLRGGDGLARSVGGDVLSVDCKRIGQMGRSITPDIELSCLNQPIAEISSTASSQIIGLTATTSSIDHGCLARSAESVPLHVSESREGFVWQWLRPEMQSSSGFLSSSSLMENHLWNMESSQTVDIMNSRVFPPISSYRQQCSILDALDLSTRTVRVTGTVGHQSAKSVSAELVMASNDNTTLQGNSLPEVDFQKYTLKHRLLHSPSYSDSDSSKVSAVAFVRSSTVSSRRRKTSTSPVHSRTSSKNSINLMARKDKIKNRKQDITRALSVSPGRDNSISALEYQRLAEIYGWNMFRENRSTTSRHSKSATRLRINSLNNDTFSSSIHTESSHCHSSGTIQHARLSRSPTSCYREEGDSYFTYCPLTTPLSYELPSLQNSNAHPFSCDDFDPNNKHWKKSQSPESIRGRRPHAVSNADSKSILPSLLPSVRCPAIEKQAACDTTICNLHAMPKYDNTFPESCSTNQTSSRQLSRKCSPVGTRAASWYYESPTFSNSLKDTVHDTLRTTESTKQLAVANISTLGTNNDTHPQLLSKKPSTSSRQSKSESDSHTESLPGTNSLSETGNNDYEVSRIDKHYRGGKRKPRFNVPSLSLSLFHPLHQPQPFNNASKDESSTTTKDLAASYLLSPTVSEHPTGLTEDIPLSPASTLKYYYRYFASIPSPHGIDKLSMPLTPAYSESSSISPSAINLMSSISPSILMADVNTTIPVAHQNCYDRIMRMIHPLSSSLTIPKDFAKLHERYLREVVPHNLPFRVMEFEHVDFSLMRECCLANMSHISIQQTTPVSKVTFDLKQNSTLPAAFDIKPTVTGVDVNKNLDPSVCLVNVFDEPDTSANIEYKTVVRPIVPAVNTTNGSGSMATSKPMSGGTFSRNRTRSCQGASTGSSIGLGDNSMESTAAKSMTSEQGLNSRTAPLQQSEVIIMSASCFKLVEKLTANVDYPFLSDFFIVYRLFMTPLQLARLITLRIRFALGWPKDTDEKRIIRFRCFVFLRYWLNEFFAQDFSRDKRLRRYMDKTIQTMSHMRILTDGEDMDGRMVKTLKHLWRSLVENEAQSEPQSQYTSVLPTHVPLSDERIGLAEEIVQASYEDKQGLSANKVSNSTGLPRIITTAEPRHNDVEQGDTILATGTASMRDSKYIAVSDDVLLHRDNNVQQVTSIEASAWKRLSLPIIRPSEISSSPLVDLPGTHLSSSLSPLSTQIFHRLSSYTSDSAPPESIDTFTVADTNTLSASRLHRRRALTISDFDITPHTSYTSSNPRPGESCITGDLNSPSSYYSSYDHMFRGSSHRSSAAYSGSYGLSTSPRTSGSTFGDIFTRKNSQSSSISHFSPSLFRRHSDHHVHQQSRQTQRQIPMTLNNNTVASGDLAKDPWNIELNLFRHTIPHKVDVYPERDAINGTSSIFADSSTYISVGHLNQDDLDKKHTALEEKIDTTVLASIINMNTDKNNDKELPQQDTIEQTTVRTTTPIDIHEHRRSKVMDQEKDTKVSGLVKGAMGRFKKMVVKIWSPNQSAAEEDASHFGDDDASDWTENEHKKHISRRHSNYKPITSSTLEKSPALVNKSLTITTTASSIKTMTSTTPPQDIPRKNVAYKRLSIISLTKRTRPPATFQRRSIDAPFMLKAKSIELGRYLSLLEQVAIRCVRYTELLDIAAGRHEYLKKMGKRSHVGGTWDANIMLENEDNNKYGIKGVIDRFNMTSQWVATQIVTVSNISLRACVLEKFIKVALICEKYQNYSTLMAITLALQSPSIDRLKKTWARVTPEKRAALDNLIALTSPFHNFRRLREAMDSTVSGGVPFLGIYLSDLVFNNELPATLPISPTDSSAPSPVASESTSYDHRDPQMLYEEFASLKTLVNWHKYRMIAKIVKQFKTFLDGPSYASQEWAFGDEYWHCLYMHQHVLDNADIARLSVKCERRPGKSGCPE